MTRGDQKPEKFPLVKVPASSTTWPISFPRNNTPFECSYFIKNGVPDPKLGTIAFYSTDKNGKNPVLLAQTEVNFSNHFGAQFEEATKDLQPTPQAQAMNLICHSFKFKAHIIPKKDKDSDALAECVAWRQGDHQQEQQKIAKEAELKRLEELRKSADKAELSRQRASMADPTKQPIRGLGGFATVAS